MIIIAIPSIAVLYFGLTRDPRTLPSALVKKPAPLFSLINLEGKSVSLTEAKGHPVVLNFWSTWCGPCLAEHQTIRHGIHLFEPQGVIFYSILYEDSPENAQAFIREYGKAAEVLLDPGLRSAIDYGVAGVPETFFIDREGRIVHKQTGVLTMEVLVGTLEKLIQSTVAP